MRRKDREITDFDEMMKIIAKCDTCRLALFDDEFPYIVPLNFGTNVEEGQLYLYFHSAKEGTKLDLIRKNNKWIVNIILLCMMKECHVQWGMKVSLDMVL